MAVIPDDDAVSRMVDRAVDANVRMLVAYMDNMKAAIKAEVERELRAEFAGDQVYFGKGSADRKATRNAAIRSDARPRDQGGLGLSIRALSRKYHLGKTQIATILAEDVEALTGKE